MERKIGERFDYNGTTLEVVDNPNHSCHECFFNNKSFNFCIKEIKCRWSERIEHKNVYFKEVSK